MQMKPVDSGVPLHLGADEACRFRRTTVLVEHELRHLANGVYATMLMPVQSGLYYTSLMHTVSENHHLLTKHAF